MQISELLTTDWRVQEIVKKQSQTLKEDQCLYALNVLGGITFKKVKIRNKEFFRKLYSIFNPVYIVSFPLKDNEEVRLMGMTIKFMEKEKPASFEN